MNQHKLMNQYIANLAVLNIKFHNMHWNVVGERFEEVHVYLERLYTDFFEKYDEMAERVKMIGEFPAASMKDYFEITTVKELGNKLYKTDEVYDIVEEELKNLKSLLVTIRKEADGNDDFVTVSLTEDHITIFDKELWFIKSIRG